MLELKKATKEKCKLRLVLVGVPGAGKTFSALSIAANLVPGGKVLVLDSEYGSASKYADLFDFYTQEVTDHDPRNYIKMIKEAGQLGIDVLIIDSLSHAWQALLDLVSKEGAKSKNPYGGWDKGTPIQRELVEAILSSKCHIIATARQKSEYVVAPNHNGKMTPTKIGMRSEQKADIEFEFDVAGELDTDNSLRITKTRCPAINNKTFHKPGKELAETLRNWLDAGAAPAPKTSAPATATTGNHQDAGAQKSENAGSLSATPTTTKESAHPLTGQPTATSKPTSESVCGDADPKPQTTSVPIPGGSENSQSAAQSASSGTATAITQTEMGQLLQVAVKNGWDKKQISNFICQTFKIEAAKVTEQLTRKEYDTVLKLFSRPENAGGRVMVNGEGKPLAAEHCWPKA